ncbi:endolytic transglycosylase MltG [Mycetocola spongiae]|uniref:endolytic transglycosylase MltG n=1 Tax=Mycetocola spongiae TaxID=2859226 RepID=UPI001CF2B4D6|nr:endolytic transglycosylase MltG [Mycetocola spongiae]
MPEQNDPLDEAFAALTGELPRVAPPAAEPEPDLPPPTSRREARERAVIAESRAQRRAEAEAALEQNATVAVKPRRRRRALIVTLISILVVVGLGTAVTITWNSFMPQLIEKFSNAAPEDYQGSGEGQVTVSIAEGDDGTAVARSLHAAGVTASVDAFYRLLLSTPEEPVFHPGLYSLRTKMSAESALTALLNPGNRLQGGVLVREGETGRTILPNVASAIDVSLEEMEAAAANPADFGLPADAPSLEGWLFPATYTFPDKSTPHEALQIMVDRTVKALNDAGVPADQYERILTFASIVEREARQPQDFPKVARVIENRLAVDMKLQMDSTAQYGTGQADGSVWSSAESLREKNDWNTYERQGLPVGPIANPGDRAIEAAMNPEPGDWLFFVTVDLDTGETVFNTTDAEHEKAVAQLRAWCSANPGKGC